MKRDIGVIKFNGETICYERADEWVNQQQPGAAGGVLTIPIRTGNKVLEARIFGTEPLIEITPALRVAIEVDEHHQRNK